MILNKRNMSPAEKARIENAAAQTEKNKADIDYIAMMADIDIDLEDEEGTENEPEI